MDAFFDLVSPRTFWRVLLFLHFMMAVVLLAAVTLQTVAIPVFQFGLFSENDLSFFAGPNFNFGGRVHSNANIFLAEGDGATLRWARWNFFLPACAGVRPQNPLRREAH